MGSGSRTGGGLACRVGPDMTAGRAARVDTEELVARFLAGYSERTRQAYATDLDDFARFRGQSRAAAIAELLAGRELGRRLALDFAVELRRRGLAPATVGGAEHAELAGRAGRRAGRGEMVAGSAERGGGGGR